MYKKISKKILFILFSLCLSAFAEADLAKSKSAETIQKDSIELIANKNNSITRYIALPLKYTVQPVIGAILYPTVPVVDYVFKERVIERAVDLFSVGENNDFMLFPTANVILNQGSYFGFHMIYRNAFGFEGNRWVVNYKHHLNLEWLLKTDYGISDYFVPKLYAKFGYRQGQTELVGYSSPISQSYNRYQEEYVDYYHADSSYSFYHRLSYPITSTQEISIEGRYNQYLFSPPGGVAMPINGNQAIEDLYERKLFQDYHQKTITIGWSRDTRESKYASTYGSLKNLEVEYAQVEGGGDYWGISGFLNNYWLLGSKQFHFTREEDRQAKRDFRKFSLQKAIDFLRPDQLSEFLSERKVIVSYLSFRQAFRAGNDKVPLTGFNKLSFNTPLRGYSGQPLMSLGYLGWSLEYRWPMIDKLDGLVFNEYVLPFESPESIYLDQVRNSWGFGFRVRKPNFFFLRIQLGFNGFNGYSLQASVSPTYP